MLLALFLSKLPIWFWEYNTAKEVTIQLPYQIWLSCKKIAEETPSEMLKFENNELIFMGIPVHYNYRPEIIIFNPQLVLIEEKSSYIMELELIHVNLN